MPSLTQDLLDSDKEGFHAATQSKFLELAGRGKLSKDVLQKWLGMDRLYAQAYVRFASLLLANIKLPSSINPKHINERCVAPTSYFPTFPFPELT
jgi:thiaminase